MPQTSLKSPDRPLSFESLRNINSETLRAHYNAFCEKTEQVAQWLDARPVLLVALLLGAYGFVAVIHSCFRPMWHDELITFDLALSPSVAQMLRDLHRIDLNPPLLYVLDYVSLRFPGAQINEHFALLAARFPSLLAGLVASLGLFALVRSRSGPLYALAAVAFLWKTEFLRYVWENRPYALLCGFLVLLILVWGRASKPHRHPAWVGAVLLVSLAMMSSHLFASFLLVAFLMAEIARTWREKRFDVPMFFAFLLPLGIPLAYARLLPIYGRVEFPAAFQVSVGKLAVSYVSLLDNCATVLVPILVLCLLATAVRKKGGEAELGAEAAASTSPITLPEWVLLLGILAEPVFSAISIGRLHGAFFRRYGLPSCISMVLLLIAFLYWRFGGLRRVALIAVIASCVNPLLQFAHHPLQYLTLRDDPSFAATPLGYRAVDPNLPFVDASVLTFVEMNHRESSEFLSRTYFLTDRSRAIRYSHATLWEGEAEVVRILHFRGQVEDFGEFETAHPHFLVLGTYNHPEEWLLRTLIAEGHTVRYLGSFETSYIDKDLYEVTIRPKR
jgi:hypothetical protein